MPSGAVSLLFVYSTQSTQIMNRLLDRLFIRCTQHCIAPLPSKFSFFHSTHNVSPRVALVQFGYDGQDRTTQRQLWKIPRVYIEGFGSSTKFNQHDAVV